MKKFAYIDKKEIMHVVEKKETAKEYSKNGKVVETEIPAKNGFPLDENGEGVIVYSPYVMKLDAHGSKIEPIPTLAELYKECE